MSLEDAFVLDRVREALGASCDPQLRLVSKRCTQVMDKFKIERPELSAYVASVSLLLWAKNNLKMSLKGVCDEAAKGGHLETLMWARCVYVYCVCVYCVCVCVMCMCNV
jgi:hypothetical protein